uniref:C-type lectin domain-containing protein n=1 Tax=Neogobius melanostomus TaxID=47308 RepID=A0A8C6S8U1_9GOBI
YIYVLGLCSLSVGHRRVYHLIKDEKNWTDATKYCQEHYTDLATVNEQTDVSCVCPEKHDCKNAWVRLNFPQTTNAEWNLNWNLNIRCLIGLLVPAISSQFCSQQRKACAYLGANNQWVSRDCTHGHSFICYDDHMVLVKEKMTWEEALIHCRRNYGELAMMTTDQLRKMVVKKSEMADTDYVWVGLHFSCFFEEWLWVNGHWVSSDDEHWEKQNEHPDCNVSGAMQKTGKGKWVKRPSEDRYNFVCAVHCGPNKK